MKKINNYHIASIVSKVTLWLGIVIILSSLIYMILNLADADNFIAIWKFFMIIGVSFCLIGGVLGKMVIRVHQNRHY